MYYLNTGSEMQVTSLKALLYAWYNSWSNGPGKHSWQEFVIGMHCRFGCSHLALSIACMWDNLKQKDSVEEYIKAHKKIHQLSENQV